MRPSVMFMMLAATACGQPVMPRSGVPTLDDAVADNFVAVSAGKEHTCALLADGAAYCWGSNEFGQLGVVADTTTCFREDRPIACQRRPVAAAAGMRFRKISAGRAHTCGLAVDSHVYCWGDNLDGQLGDPGVRRSSTPVAALTSDAFTDVAAGGFHSCALRTDGVLFCWGNNDDGQLGLATVGNGSAVPIATQTSQRFASVAAGNRRTCARVPDGTSYCAGATWVSRQNGVEVTRPVGQLFKVLQSPPFESLAVGTNTTCGITVDNSAYCWEANAAGSIGDGTTSGSTFPRPVSGGLRFVSVSVGFLESCAVADTGLAYCWGADGAGQLGVSPGTVNSRCGNPAFACSPIPVRVSGWRVFTQVSAGQGDHVCGVTLSGSIYCWGAGGLGQRGDGGTANLSSPTRILSP